MCLALCDPIDCSPPGSFVHGILQARVLEWVSISSSRGSSQPRDQTHVSSGFFIGRQIFFLSFFFFFFLKDNYFTEFCCFQSNLSMNQPYVYIYSLSFEAPSCLPPHPTCPGWYRAPVWVSWATQQIPIGYLFTFGNVSFHVTLSIHLTLSPLSPCP